MFKRILSVPKKAFTVFLISALLFTAHAPAFAQSFDIIRVRQGDLNNYTAADMSAVKKVPCPFTNDGLKAFRGMALDNAGLKKVLREGLLLSETSSSNNILSRSLAASGNIGCGGVNGGNYDIKLINFANSPSSALGYGLKELSSAKNILTLVVKKDAGDMLGFCGVKAYPCNINPSEIDVYIFSDIGHGPQWNKISYENGEITISPRSITERLKTLNAADRVSEIAKSPNPGEMAELYFGEAGVKELPEMIARAQEQIELKINGRVPAEFLTEAFAKSMLERTYQLEKSLDKIVKKYPQEQRAAKKAEFTNEMKEGRIPNEVAEAIYPKSVDSAKKLGFWDIIKFKFRNGSAAEIGNKAALAMLGFIIVMELISGKAQANNTGFEKRLVLGEIIGGEAGPALAGTFCAAEPGIMGSIIQNYAGDKEELESGLKKHFKKQMGLLSSENIMNEPVVKTASEEYNKQQLAKRAAASAKQASLQKSLQRNDGVQNARNAMFEGRAMLGPR